MNEELCNCGDCLDSEDACHLDCDRGYECAGCYEAHLENEEVMFETDCALGRR